MLCCLRNLNPSICLFLNTFHNVLSAAVELFLRLFLFILASASVKTLSFDIILSVLNYVSIIFLPLSKGELRGIVLYKSSL